jgi:antitoxin (DNA-binding transcriptional repressor) of toxin-antitoxin stability system
MAIVETLTVADLESSLIAVLERVRRGERFQIERDGKVIADLIPRPENAGITLREFLARYGDLPRPDPEFADDLEAIQAEQSMMQEPPEWPG